VHDRVLSSAARAVHAGPGNPTHTVEIRNRQDVIGDSGLMALSGS
jgi:hypothetical protein